MVDDRYVPFDHEDNNWGMIRRELISSIQIADGNLHPIPYKKTVEMSAQHYEKELKRFFGTATPFPQFDLLVMGLGTDGHTASLFPGNPALKETKKWCVATEQSGVPHPRISLTYPVLQNGGELVFMVQGKNKAARVKEILVDRDASLPATQAFSTSGRTVFLLDKEAASSL